MQTAQVLASSWGAPFQIVREFAERDVGVYDGLTKEVARLAYPALWQQDITSQWHVGPAGGEGIKAVFERVAKGLRVLLVAHGFVAKVIRAILTNPSWDDFFGYSLSNGQVELYHFSEKALTASAWLPVTAERPVD